MKVDGSRLIFFFFKVEFTPFPSVPWIVKGFRKLSFAINIEYL